MAKSDALIESSKRHLSPIWIVPLAAVVLGIWLAVNAYLKQGPTITLAFSSATGITADKTHIKARNVDVGIVTDVRLNESLDGVVVTAELSAEARRLLRDDTQFWVVRPTVKGANISGLGTLLSGAYIEVSPGVGPVSKKRNYEGLDQAPAAPAGTPGIRLKLISESSGAVGVGSPILYRGFTVGTVESNKFEIDTGRVSYSIFIDEPYDQLVSSTTRFWNTSGISAEIGPQGIRLGIGSLLSALAGGISFDLPEGSSVGNPVEPGMTFRLYPNEASIHQDPYRYHLDYVVLFEQSLGGLRSGAPVNYRGIQIGSVTRVLLQEMSTDPEIAGTGEPVPVLIRLEPARLEYEDTPAGLELARKSIEIAVTNGLRAKLETGSLLTGSLVIGMDHYRDAEQANIGNFNGIPTLPTIRGGFDQIQVQISQLLDKLNNLPLDETLIATEAAIGELQNTLAAARNVLESDDTQQLPASLRQTLAEVNSTLAGLDGNSAFQAELNRTLAELKQTLQGVQGVTDGLRSKSNSLVFPAKPTADPEPKAPTP